MGQKKLSTIWKIENHTLVKHEILKEYLNAWIPILGRTSQKIIFLDGFAGPGIYKEGEKGSPIIAIQAAIDHPMIQSVSEIHFIFIESDPERSKMLKQVIDQEFPDRPSNIHVHVISENFVQSLTAILDKIEEDNQDIAPTLAFLDPFGYSEIPIKLIIRIMKYTKCELLLTFMSGFLNRFLRDMEKQNAVDQLYGTGAWRKARDISNTNTRLNFLLDLYITQLKTNGIKFVRPFKMMDSSRRTIYDLVFATKHHKGMDAMKKAMLKVVSNGTYTFSDRTDTKQTYFVDYSDESNWINDASDSVFNHFKGKEGLLEDIRDFVLADTPFRFLKSILKHIEKNQKIISVSGRTRNGLSYADGCTVKFAES